MALHTVFFALLNLLILDVIFLLLLSAIVLVLSGTKRAAFAVMKRNFIGYFSNPTGYVFLCIFVFLTSVAAFWPYEFFNSNLATLDQLNYWYPMIMLVFIPAITMSIWAEEKRQGTDELLLTLPADDFDIVIGKYMSAAAIFTSSLLFSQLSTFTTLAILTEGDLDTGLIFTTYLGYWFVGLAMLAIGMIASFLTGNLTVGFILGGLFNAPLAFASLAGSVFPTHAITNLISQSGIATPSDDFGRGVISTSSVAYFVLAAVVALYVSMVLIGRRHWTGGKDGNQMAWHYIARTLALVVLTIGMVMLLRNRDFVRYDSTENKIASLAPATKDLIRNLNTDRPVVIDAFISKDVPEVYAKTRYELTSLLKEFRSEAAKNGRAIQVNLHENIEPFSNDADLASKRFGIEPVTRVVREKGVVTQKEVIMGAAFRSGLQNVTVPIFEYGIPVEYELVRSINTVAQGAKKRLGVVATDARLFGGNVMSGMSVQQIPRHDLMDELAKQYEVEEVDLNSPVTPGVFDALLVVQPSSLGPPQFERLITAIKAGVPVAIFEDPRPAGLSYITATGDPKQAPGGMFGGGGAPAPKGDIRQLWDALEVTAPGTPSPTYFQPNIVWQQHNPYPNFEQANELWVFVDEDIVGIEAGDALSDQSVISEGLHQVLAILPGAINGLKDSKLTHTPILSTGPASGLLTSEQAMQLMTGPTSIAQVVDGFQPSQTIAMSIEGKSGDDDEESAATIKAVYVADTDLMLPDFLMIRAAPDQVPDVRFQLQNVSFILNTIDWLTDETEFIDVRNHQPTFASLKMIDAVRGESSVEVRKQSKKFQDEYDDSLRIASEKKDKALQSTREELTKLQKEAETRDVSGEVTALRTRYQTLDQQLTRAQNIKIQSLGMQRDSQIEEIRRVADQKVTQIQNRVKLAAVALPCIPPLIIGVIVFASRRLRERENISKSRLK